MFYINFFTLNYLTLIHFTFFYIDIFDVNIFDVITPSPNFMFNLKRGGGVSERSWLVDNERFVCGLCLYLLGSFTEMLARLIIIEKYLIKNSSVFKVFCRYWTIITFINWHIGIDMTTSLMYISMFIFHGIFYKELAR